MASSLIRGKYLIRKVESRTRADIVEAGAVYQEDGRIVETGTFEELSQKYPRAEAVGSDHHVVIPGLINAHHHVGITSFQRGVPNEPLEIWACAMNGVIGTDQYLDTLYSAFEMIESGVTTVQHLHGWGPGPIDSIRKLADETLRAYRDLGMRVSYSYAVRDQNYLVYESDESFLRTLPADLARQLGTLLEAHSSITLDDYFALFEDLYERYNDEPRIRIQLAPSNLTWCSDRALGRLASYSADYDVPLHMHLLETPYQKEYAFRRSGTTAVKFLHQQGLLGSRMTLGHGTWVTPEDIDLLADSGTNICHNCSSNLALRSGIAPLNAYQYAGARVAIGIDGAGINDDRDMLQEMRLVLSVHRVPGMNPDAVPSPAQVFQMATEHGARTTPYGSEIGTLEPGKLADLVLLDWDQIAHPYLDRDVQVVDAVLHRAKSGAVDTVIIGGELVYEDGMYTRINKQEVLQALADSLADAPTAEDLTRRKLIADALPYVREYFRNYADVSMRDWMLP